MSRAERVLSLVDQLHRLDAEHEQRCGPGAQAWDPYPWLIGWIEACVKPDNGSSDMQARREAQEAIEALYRFRLYRFRQRYHLVDRAGEVAR